MKRLKSTPKDFENIPEERLMELCSFYDNQAQEYFKQMKHALNQLYSAEVQLSVLGFKRTETTITIDNETFYGYEQLDKNN